MEFRVDGFEVTGNYSPVPNYLNTITVRFTSSGISIYNQPDPSYPDEYPNIAGDKYIYLAFAESSLKYAKGYK
jgi:hypothetical protein